MHVQLPFILVVCSLQLVNSYGELSDDLSKTKQHAVVNDQSAIKRRHISMFDFIGEVYTKLNELQKKIEALSGKSSIESCPDGWLNHGNSCYFFSRGKATWFDSLIECKERHAYLAEINSDSENDFLKGKVDALKDHFWIGGTDIFKENHWIWITSQTLITTSQFSDWRGIQPDNAGNRENCMDLRDHIPGWNDYVCDDKQRFICEKNLK